MKNTIILIFAAIFWLGATAQENELRGGMGLNFGSSKEDAKAMMKTKHPEAKFDEEKNNVLFYMGGTWIGKKVLIWAFRYTNADKLHTMSVYMEPVNSVEVFNRYDDVVKDLSSKYGEPTETIANWRYPYEAKDKYDHGVVAIKNEKCVMMTYWQWPNPLGTAEDLKNSILVEITKDMSIKVTYQDGVLIKDVTKARTQEKQSEM